MRGITEAQLLRDPMHDARTRLPFVALMAGSAARSRIAHATLRDIAQ
jgi:hypothetical protein